MFDQVYRFESIFKCTPRHATTDIGQVDSGTMIRMETMEQPSDKSTPTRARTVDLVRDTSSPHNSATIQYPPAWYYFASVKELARGPVSKQLIGKSLVGFLTESGQPGVLSDRCAHMGSQLAGGCVVGENLQCSLHHWQFGTDGHCSHVPATENIPSFARQTSYPAVVRHGYVYFFNGRAPDFPLPFFDSLSPDDLVASRPFVETVHCPWYMIGANAVDTQHFAIAHDRTLQQLPEVDYPDPLAHRVVLHFQVTGDSLADRVTKYFGGANVRLQVTDWCSTMVFAHSTLARTETFGMLSIVPLAPDRTLVHATIMARASEGRFQRRLLDPFRAAIRRSLIRKFLRSDIDRLSGTRYSPQTFIDIDAQFADYFQWLTKVIHRHNIGTKS